MVSTFSWAEFTKLKSALLGKITRYLGDINSTEFVRLTTLFNCLKNLTQDNFTDLTYRYIISDKCLKVLSRSLENRNER